MTSKVMQFIDKMEPLQKITQRELMAATKSSSGTVSVIVKKAIKERKLVVKGRKDGSKILLKTIDNKNMERMMGKKRNPTELQPGEINISDSEMTIVMEIKGTPKQIGELFFNIGGHR